MPLTRSVTIISNRKRQIATKAKTDSNIIQKKHCDMCHVLSNIKIIITNNCNIPCRRRLRDVSARNRCINVHSNMFRFINQCAKFPHGIWAISGVVALLVELFIVTTDGRVASAVNAPN